MKHASLAALYRPQTFAEVTGQDMITTVLSRAAAEDRVAPAYLLSGTRGVGKTTIARILAKALNCEKAPTAEPCNQCANCQMITKGNHVDVTEIDGASNNSVEDARALRENIGYAPMEGRYKVFIIDEAHMLSRSAFNALLKTLEEPPPRVVFVFATTEVHKFPITIVSRCQHFIFKRLSEDGLVAHLTRVLTKEEVSFDPQAVRTIARRANGSVRDSMSLLGQTLALGDNSLSMQSTRAVLGLAGQELFMALMEAVAQENCPAVIELMQKLSDQGIDIGFFLRELINLWRTLFLLREAGQAILPSLGLNEEESQTWLDLAAKFSAAHLHAAWHMTLDAQRKVIHSPEPAAALELLLVNLTLMPRLLPIQAASMPSATSEEKKNTSEQQLAPTQSHAPEHSAHVSSAQVGSAQVGSVQRVASHAAPNSASGSALGSAPKAVPKPATYSPPTKQTPAPTMTPPWEETKAPAAPATPPSQAHAMARTEPTFSQSAEDEFFETPPIQEVGYSHEIWEEPQNFTCAPAPFSTDKISNNLETSNQYTAAPQHAVQEHMPAQGQEPTWQEILQHICAQSPAIVPDIFLQQATGLFKEGVLHIHTKSFAVYDRIERAREELQQAVQALCRYTVQIQVVRPSKTIKTESSLVEEFNARADLKDCLEILDASIYKVRPLNDT